MGMSAGCPEAGDPLRCRALFAGASSSSLDHQHGRRREPVQHLRPPRRPRRRLHDPQLEHHRRSSPRPAARPLAPNPRGRTQRQIPDPRRPRLARVPRFTRLDALHPPQRSHQQPDPAAPRPRTRLDGKPIIDQMRVRASGERLGRRPVRDVHWWLRKRLVSARRPDGIKSGPRPSPSRRPVLCRMRPPAATLPPGC